MLVLGLIKAWPEQASRWFGDGNASCFNFQRPKTYEQHKRRYLTRIVERHFIIRQNHCLLGGEGVSYDH